MEIDEEIASLAVIGSKYTSQQTIYTSSTPGLQKILSADRRRFSVRFMSNGGILTMSSIVPGPPPSGLTTSNVSSLFVDWFFPQWPGIVGGEFYCNMGSPQSILIIEQLYLG